MTEKEVIEHYPKHLQMHDALSDKVEKIDWRVVISESEIKEIQDWWKWVLRLVLGTIILAVLGLIFVNK